MKYLILFVLALALVASIPCEADARWYPGKRFAQNVAARREAGEGLFQGNGPIRRGLGLSGGAVRGCAAGSCGR